MHLEVEETKVKAGIMGNDDCPTEKLLELRKDSLNPRLVPEHVVGDASQTGDPGWNMLPWIEQGMKFFAKTPVADANRGDFSNGRFTRLEAGCFEVENDKLGIVEWSIEVGMRGERPAICFRIVGTVLVRTKGRMDEACT